MAETTAMMPSPVMGEASDASDQGAQMSMSDAMDMLDEHGITAENYQDIMSAIEVVHGEDEQGQLAEAPADDSAMMQQIFASDRQRGV